MSQYLNHNSNYVLDNNPVLFSNNRSFRYGDALFETIRVIKNKPQLLSYHIQRLLKGMAILKMTIPDFYTVNYFEQAILELAQKNNLLNDSRVRLVVYRNDGGLYTPDTNEVSYLIEMSGIEENGYVLNTKGLTVDLFSEYKKTPSAIASIKSSNGLLYVLAGIFKKENHLDECILINDNLNIIEAISSNVFAVKNGVLYTPPIFDGCVEGVMRRRIIEIANENKIAVYENSIMQNVLLGSDELFLTNSIFGIKWVVAYKQKRYFNKTSKRLIELLNANVQS